jgi:hypothetical protein
MAYQQDQFCIDHPESARCRGQITTPTPPDQIGHHDPPNDMPPGGPGNSGGGALWAQYAGSQLGHNPWDKYDSMFPSLDISKYYSPDKSIYDFYLQRSPEYTQSLQGIGQLSKSLGEDYKNASDYYTELLKGGSAATSRFIAPMTENLRKVYAGAQSGIESGGLRGGAREQALAQLNQQKAGEIGGAVERAQPMAAQALNQGSGAAAQAMAGFGQIAGLEQGRYQGAAAAELQNRMGVLQGELGKYGIDVSKFVNLRGQDIQESEFTRGLSEQQRESDLNRQAQIDQFQQNLDLMNKYFGLASQKQTWQMTFEEQQLEAAKKAEKGKAIGSIFGKIPIFGGMLGGIGRSIAGKGGASGGGVYDSNGGYLGE